MYSDYKKLEVWQKAMEVTDEVYKLVKLLPNEEKYALSDQMRRCAVSIPSNIAEGKGRESEKEVLRFFSIALGSKSELETQLLICVRQGFLTNQQIEKSMLLLEKISKMLTKYINNRKNKIGR